MDMDMLNAISRMMDEKLEPIISEQSEMRKEQVEMRKEQVEMRKEQAEMRKDIRDLNNAFAVIEHDHGNKLNILIDGVDACNTEIRLIRETLREHSEDISMLKAQAR